jgi:hypothetical protein
MSDAHPGSDKDPGRENGTDTSAPNEPAGASKAPNGASNGEADGLEGNKSGTHKKSGPISTKTLKEHIKLKGPPGGYDQTPPPDAPQGFTVRFTFRSAHNLPPADLSTASSDPYLIATIKPNSPKRHKEDPDLTYRTRTLRKTTEPEWMDQWVVANIPSNGFTLKCRMYDEDTPDGDDRLGNVTVNIPEVHEGWEGIPPPGKTYEGKKRVISRHAYMIKGLTSLFNSNHHMTPTLCISMELLGPSEPPFSQVHTLGPSRYIKHFSPMIGRLAGTKVDHDRTEGQSGAGGDRPESKKSQKYE